MWRLEAVSLCGLCQAPIGLFLLIGGMSGVWRVDRMDRPNVGL